MDPLTALGLASNIIQFADFSLKLFITSAEIVRSAAGASENNLDLENAYSRLQNFTTELQFVDSQSEPPDPAASAEELAHANKIRPHIAAILEIATDCQRVNTELLGTLSSLRVDPAASNRRIRAVGVALKSVLKSKKIEELEKRLGRFQQLLILHFFPLLNEHPAYLNRRLLSIERQNRYSAAEQSAMLQKISCQVNDLTQKTQELSIHRFSAEGTHPCPVDIDSLRELLGRLRLAETDLTAASMTAHLLRSLNFEKRSHRHESIHDAHKATFEWIFSDQSRTHNPGIKTNIAASTTNAANNFTTWLESGKGIFWISGKPGAGKSTLMKFIAGHAKTRSTLERMSKGGNVVIASHYFWSPGTSMQNSLKGLLQELLFDILSHCPELAQEIFPDRMGRRILNRCSNPPTDQFEGSEWTVGELRQGLQQISQHKFSQNRFCFFIDGLDEYSGDHSELCQTLKDLATSENVQCCVSSRPHNVFELAFGEGSKTKSAYIRVHELTYRDINVFARSRLQTDAQWEDARLDDTETDSIAMYITDHAHGVFLWVYLVTKSLRQGLIDGDTFDDLQIRLQSMPTELEPYFKNMLDRVNVTNHDYMARTLQMALNAKTPLDLITYAASEYELKNKDYALEQSPDWDVVRFDLSPKTFMPYRRRINSRCGGLLAFNLTDVEFIHRTVHDFLRTAPMQDYLTSKLSSDFSPNLSTLKALVFLFRCYVRSVATSALTDIDDRMMIMWSDCLVYFNGAMDEDEVTAMQLLDTAVRIPEYETSPSNARRVEELIYCDFEQFVSRTVAGRGENIFVSFGLHQTCFQAGGERFALAQLKNNLHYFDSKYVSPLAAVLQGSKRWQWIDTEIVLLLLKSGCDPNEEIEGKERSPWITLLHRRGLLLTPDGCSVLTAFVKHGASRARIFRHDNTTDMCAVRRFLDLYLGESAPTHLKIPSVLMIVDAFFDASPEENLIQIEDILASIGRWRNVPPRPALANEKLAIAAFFDKIVLMAIQLGIRASDLSGVAGNEAVHSVLSPIVLTALKMYTKSRLV